MRRALLIVLVTGLAGCGGDPKMLNLRATGEGPDEFAILPTKPLTLPQDVAALPPPTPGGVNLTDPTPQADAYAALGGSAGALAGGPDGGIINYAARNGIAQDIRTALAADDLEYRRRRPSRPLERIFGVTTYYRAYEGQSLDQYRELERFRRAGIRTPAAPPQDAEEIELLPAPRGPSIFGPSGGGRRRILDEL